MGSISTMKGTINGFRYLHLNNYICDVSVNQMINSILNYIPKDRG